MVGQKPEIKKQKMWRKKIRTEDAQNVKLEEGV